MRLAAPWEAPCLVWENSALFTTGGGLWVNNNVQAPSAGKAPSEKELLRLSGVFSCVHFEPEPPEQLLLSEGDT